MLHVVAVVDLAVPAKRTRVGIIIVLAALKDILMQHDVVHVHKSNKFVAEALTFHIDIQEGFLVHETCIEIMEHFCMATVLHDGTSCDSQQMTVSSLLKLLFIKVLHIWAPVFDHGWVILIVTGRKNNGFICVEFHIAAVAEFADGPDDLVAILNKLHARRAVVYLHVIRILLRCLIQNIAQECTDVVRLGAHPRGIHMCFGLAVIKHAVSLVRPLPVKS